MVVGLGNMACGDRWKELLFTLGKKVLRRISNTILRFVVKHDLINKYYLIFTERETKHNQLQWYHGIIEWLKLEVTSKKSCSNPPITGRDVTHKTTH